MKNEWQYILTEEQIQKKKKSDLKHSIFVYTMFGGFILFSFFFVGWILSVFYLSALVIIAPVSFSFYGKFVVRIKIEEDGFWIEKETGFQEYIPYSSIFKMAPSHISKMGGKVFVITHLGHRIDGLIERLSHRGLGTQPVAWDYIVVPRFKGLEIYEHWAEKIEENREFKGQEKLSRWLKRVYRKYSKVIMFWDTLTLILVILLKFNMIQIKMKASILSVLPLALYTFIPMFIGGAAIAIYWSYAEMKGDIEELERKGAPSL